MVGNVSVSLPLNQKPKSRAQCMARPQGYNYTTDMFADAAVAWLHGRAARQEAAEAAAFRPFFAYVSFTVPHAGGWGSAPQAPEQGQPVPSDLMYANQSAWPNVERDHAASTSYLDARIGDLLAALKATGVEATTAVFFASDNGAHNEGGHDVRFFNSTGGLRGFKRSYYEGGVRSPSLVRWPAVTPAGTSSPTPWAFWDVLPTLLEIAGVTPPPNATLDGRSIVPALRGQPMEPPVYLYWTWRGEVDADGAPPADGSEPLGAVGGRARPGYAARVWLSTWGAWKVVVHACASASLTPSMEDVMELYNLTADPFETDDVAARGAGPKITAAAKQLLMRQRPPLSCVCYQC